MKLKDSRLYKATHPFEQRRGSDADKPFQVQRLVLVDYDKREALCDLGSDGVGWIQLDSFPISSPVWRRLDDTEFTKLARSFRALRSARH